MNKTIEISLQAAQDMLPCLESRLAYLEGQVAESTAQRDSVKTTLAEIRAKLNGGNGELPFQNGGKLPQRLPKGDGERRIYEVLLTLPAGQGLTVTQIKVRTGVKHSTVYRTLHESKRNKGRFVSKNGLWRLADIFQPGLAPQEEKTTIMRQ